MNPDLSAARSVAILNELKRCVSEAAQAEEELRLDLRTKRFHVDRRLQGAVKAIEERRAAASGEDDEHCTALENQVRATHESRRKRIERFKHTGTRDFNQLSQRQREAFLGKLQVRKVRLDRERARELAAVSEEGQAEAGAIDAYAPLLSALDRGARSYFSGHGRFVSMLDREKAAAKVTPLNSATLAPLLDEACSTVKADLTEFKKLVLPRLFSLLPPAGFYILAAVVGAGAAFFLAPKTIMPIATVGAAVGGLALVVIMHLLSARQGSELARKIASRLGEARSLMQASSVHAHGACESQMASISAKFDAEAARLQSDWDNVGEIQAEFERRLRDKISTKVPALLARNDELLASKLRFIRSTADSQKRSADSAEGAEKQKHQDVHDREMAVLADEEARRFAAIESAFKSTTQALYAELEGLQNTAAANVPAWGADVLESWTPAKQFTEATKFGSISMDLTPALPKDPRLALPGAPAIVAPMMLSYPRQGCILIETNSASDSGASSTINNIIVRLLCAMPPGKVAFTILDPVGLGQNFAGVMHLGDYEETLINRRIWTQRDQIEERLAELNDHIEKVIQMYLRNEYETITQYNAEAGAVAEKYHFLVVADFPSNFSDIAAKRLQSIAVSGPRCGVFTLIHWDKRQSLPDGFAPDELRACSACIESDGARFVAHGAPAEAKLVLDAAPSDELAVPLLHKIGKASIDSNRIEVPFTQIAPKPDELWTGDTTTELRVPVGRTGATKMQYLAIGKGTRQHALFAGKTGSGKSTLFHVIITNLALHCSPEMVEFYLIDFKKGVEFKCYATHKLPHAKVVAIESDREFGLSVLQRVDEELKRRGDIFRKLGVQDIPGYKKAGGTEPMPRCLLLIDEFQEFFVEDDSVAQNASVLFDRIVRQGRAFGIHVLLGSQTLGGAFTLAKATMGQMVIRVALQCNEADAYLIMDENNPAPRLLTRPGEGIYNDSAGAIEGNSPFQVCWLGDDERDRWLDKAAELAQQRGVKYAGPIVFEGNAPADIRENYLLAQALASKPDKAPASGRMWLGAPNSIKGPTEAVFHRQSGSHLLIVGQREDVTQTMLGIGLISLAAQYPKGGVKLYFFHATPPETPDERFLRRIFDSTGHQVREVRGHEIADAMNELSEMQKERTSGEVLNGPPVFVFISGLHKFKKLKADDDMSFSFSSSESSGPSSSEQLSSLITEGSTQSMHLIVTTDTYNNVTRFLSRKLLTEFEMRLVFQMSANDSASLIDSPKASNLGLHRALLHNEQAGTLETFRPYAEPDAAWFDEAAAALSQR